MLHVKGCTCATARTRTKRATEQPKPKDYNKDYHVDLGTRSVSPYTFTVAVLEHTSASQRLVLLACLANAASQRTALEAHTRSNANTNPIATIVAKKPTMDCGSALRLLVSGGELLASMGTTLASPCCKTTAEHAPQQEQHYERTGALPKHEEYDYDDWYPTLRLSLIHI